MKRSKLVKTDC